MKRNHFIISYNGNKRQEVAKIYESLNLDGITTIVEPFCGTSALSYYIAQLHPKRFKYVLNDTNRSLIRMYEIMQDPEKLARFRFAVDVLISGLIRIKDRTAQKAHYNDLKNATQDIGVFFMQSAYKQIHFGAYPVNIISKPKALNLTMCDFLQEEDVSITSQDGIDTFTQHAGDSNTLIFLDPPYMFSNNSEYKDSCAESFNIYGYMLENPLRHARVVATLEYTWIIRYMFGDEEIITYPKMYAVSQKKTTHAIILFKPAVKLNV